MRTLLQRRIIGQTTTRQLQALLAAHLPVLEKPISAARWKRRAKRERQQMLKLFFRGHADGLLDEIALIEPLVRAWLSPTHAFG